MAVENNRQQQQGGWIAPAIGTALGGAAVGAAGRYVTYDKLGKLQEHVASNQEFLNQEVKDQFQKKVNTLDDTYSKKKVAKDSINIKLSDVNTADKTVLQEIGIENTNDSKLKVKAKKLQAFLDKDSGNRQKLTDVLGAHGFSDKAKAGEVLDNIVAGVGGKKQLNVAKANLSYAKDLIDGKDVSNAAEAQKNAHGDMKKSEGVIENVKKKASEYAEIVDGKIKSVKEEGAKIINPARRGAALKWAGFAAAGGALVYGAYRFLTGGAKEEAPEETNPLASTTIANV